MTTTGEEFEQLRDRVRALEVKQEMLETNLADLLGSVGIDDVLAREEAWWWEHDQRRARLGRKTPLRGLRL